MEGDMNDLSNKGLKRHKVGLLAVVGTIYSLTAAGAYGIEDMVPSVGPGLCMVMLILNFGGSRWAGGELWEATLIP